MLNADKEPLNSEFDGNIYCAPAGKFVYKWGGRVFREINKWRKDTGREKLGGEVDCDKAKLAPCGSVKNSPVALGGRRIAVPARGTAGRICEAVLCANWPEGTVGAPLGYNIFGGKKAV